MFKVIDMCDYIHDAYGTFIDKDGDVQFILCNSDGEFYKTDAVKGYYKLYEESTEYDLCIIFPQTIGDITFYNRHELIEWVMNQQKQKMVKHGHWILLDECSNAGVYCSVCSKKVYRTDYANQKIKSKYCPNCGSIMDEEFKKL